MATKLELAQRLKAQLDAVTTNADALEVGAAWLRLGVGSWEKLGGFQGGMVSDAEIVPEVNALRDQLRGFPAAGPLDLPLWEGPAGLRRAIQRVAAAVWAQEDAFPEGLSIADDAGDFVDGAEEALTDTFKRAGEIVAGAADVGGKLAGGLLKGLWPVLLVAAVVVAAVVIAKPKVSV